MGCGSSKTYLQAEAENQAANVVCDINALTRAFAKDQFINTATWSQRKIPLSDLVFTPHWEELTIQHYPPVYEDVTSARDEQPVVLVNQEYQNKDDTEVQHTFRGERRTSCVCKVEIENGVIFHKGIDIALKTFSENPAGRKFPREVTLGKHPGDVSIAMEETTPWTMETTRPIGPFKTVVARLQMEEEEHDLTFSMVTTVTVPQKGLRISVRDKEGTFITTLVGYPQGFLSGLGNKVLVEKNQVHFVSEGKAYFRFGTKTVEDSQEINQHQRQQQQQQRQQQQQQQYLQQQHQYIPGMYPRIPGENN